MERLEPSRTPLERVGRFLGHVLSPLPLDAPDFMSNHYRARGAAEMLDSHLDDRTVFASDMGHTVLANYGEIADGLAESLQA